MRISELKLRDKLPALSLTLEPDRIKDYIEAVEESSGYFTQCNPGEIAPPLACASLAIGALVNKMELPAGTIHLSQEITSSRPAKVGKTVLCHTSIIRDQVRRNLRIMTLKLEINDEAGNAVLEGKTTFVLPQQGKEVS